ncbi:hypothetical protein [Mycobacterium noviomagense]|uniref:hypothetical protein n=1 Tax=Mycobacterium noviomagense TaxID=459858 RepID=UPI0013D619DD|nr:hypothetical protein [Mycobacterium noviomagense]
MAETPAPPVTQPRAKPERLFQIAAWVAIVAGVVFIIATVLLFICAFVCCR